LTTCRRDDFVRVLEIMESPSTCYETCKSYTCLAGASASKMRGESNVTLPVRW
jgi:hypothetical protein